MQTLRPIEEVFNKIPGGSRAQENAEKSYQIVKLFIRSQIVGKLLSSAYVPMCIWVLVLEREYSFKKSSNLPLLLGTKKVKYLWLRQLLPVTQGKPSKKKNKIH